MSQSSPSGPTWPQALQYEQVNDRLDEALQRRVAMLELALVDRRIRRRLRRVIRQGQRDFAWAADDAVGIRQESWFNLHLAGVA